MAISEDKKRLYIDTENNKGITPWEVAQCLGDYRVTSLGRDVGLLCTSPNINIWAKYKPVYIYSFGILTEEDRKQVNYGLYIGKEGLYNYIGYTRPSGGTMPYRLADFDGYNHGAKSPLMWASDQVSDPDTGEVLLATVNPADTDSVDFREMTVFTKKIVDGVRYDASFEILAFNRNDGFVSLGKGNVADFPLSVSRTFPELCGTYTLFVVMDTYLKQSTNPYGVERTDSFDNYKTITVNPLVRILHSFGGSTVAFSDYDINTQKAFSAFTEASPLTFNDYLRCTFTLNQNNSGTTMNKDTFAIAMRYADSAGNDVTEYLTLAQVDGQTSAVIENWSLSASSGIFSWRIDLSNTSLPAGVSTQVTMWAVVRPDASKNWSRAAESRFTTFLYRNA